MKALLIRIIMYDLKEDYDEKEKEHILKDSDVCEECGGRGVIEHHCMPGHYGDCPVCGVP